MAKLVVISDMHKNKIMVTKIFNSFFAATMAIIEKISVFNAVSNIMCFRFNFVFKYLPPSYVYNDDIVIIKFIYNVINSYSEIH